MKLFFLFCIAALCSLSSVAMLTKLTAVPYARAHARISSRSKHLTHNSNTDRLKAKHTQRCSYEFAWDIHDVLVRKKVSRMTLKALTQATTPTLSALGKATLESVWALTNIGPTPTIKFFNKIAHLAINQGASEEFKQVLNEYDPRLWPAVVSILTEQYPINGMKEILQEIHQHGYVSRAASNISAEEFTILAARHPEIFCYLQPGVITHHRDTTIIKKPDPRFFEQYYQLYRNDNTKVIFIDDRPDNVQVANKAGMIGILFSSPAQLRQDLEAIGILSR